MPPASRQYPTLEGWNQNTLRSVVITFDQHRSKDFPFGRPWWGYQEDAAKKGQPTGISGELLPVSCDMPLDGEIVKGWDAPWIPEPKYVQMALQTMTAGNRFRFDYERQAADRRAANVAYYTRAMKEAAERNLPIPKLYGHVSFQLRAIVGTPPKSPKLPEAAAAGDPWLLGFTQKVNEQLLEILLDEQGRSAEFLSVEEPAAPKPLTLAEQLMAMTDAEKESLAAILAPKKQPTKAVPNAA